MIILADNFEFILSGQNKEFNVNIDNSNGNVTYEFIGEGSAPSSVTSVQRGRESGSEIGRFTSEDESVIYVILASLSAPFAYLSETIPNEIEPDSCDLRFDFVNVTDETQQNANNGSINAGALSSFGGIEYSINNITWQSSGIFNNLAPGNYTLQARDSNGCRISADISIQSYDNILIKSPVENVSFGNVSRWVAAYNPIVFEFKSVGDIYNSQSNSIIRILPWNSDGIVVVVNRRFTSLEIDSLKLTPQKVTTGAGYNFTLNAEFISVESGGGQSTAFFYKHPFYGTTTGTLEVFYTKTNRFVEVEITTQYGVIIGRWSPGLNGITRADISSYLQSLVNAKDVFKYDVLNWKDPNRAASFQVRYREVWDGGSSVWYNFPNPLYVTYSAKQLGDKYGGNMAKYVPFYQENNLDRKAEFLTEFKEPIFNVGLPFDLSFIFSESIVGSNIKMRTTSLDINKNQVPGGQINSFLLNDEAGYISNADASKFIISTGALPPIQNDGIISSLGINRLMMAGDPANMVEYFQVQLYRGSDANPYFVTKPLLVRVNKPCDSDPYIYIKWINKLGGWDYYRFGFNQDYGINTKNDTLVKRNIFDYKSDSAAIDIIKKSANKSITFGASGISKDDSIGIEGMAESINVMMLVNTNPWQWLTVELNTGSFNVYKTRGNLFDVKFSISLPDINIQRQ